MLKTRNIEETREIFDRVISRRRPVTISYMRENGSTTVRTIEAYELQETKAANLIVRAMDRETGESRSWRLDRMTSYTIHRSTFLTPRPEKVSP